MYLSSAPNNESSWEQTTSYPKDTFEGDVPFPKVGYVRSLEGT